MTLAWAVPVWSPYRLRKAISIFCCLKVASIVRSQIGVAIDEPMRAPQELIDVDLLTK
jgi:hypothetical protein